MPQNTKKGRQTGGAHKQSKHKAHFIKCEKNKSRRVYKSSHGKFKDIGVYNARKVKVEKAKKNDR